jgi:hypothetical protein
LEFWQDTIAMQDLMRAKFGHHINIKGMSGDDYANLIREGYKPTPQRT